MRKKKTIKILIGLLLLLCFLPMFVVTGVRAEETVGEEEPAEMTTVKASEKISMIPGESRMVSKSVPYTASFESSNPKVAAVSNKGQITAKKEGTAKITKTDGNVKTIYTVKVNSTVDIIIFAGQSNMCGSGGNSAVAPTPATGTAYEFDISTNTKKTILMREPFGEGTNRLSGLGDTTTYSTKGTLASAFAINYYKQTKVPVVGISACWGGSSTNTWLNRGLVKETQRRVKLAKKYLAKRGVKVRHIYMVWYQGESDAAQGKSDTEYISSMQKIYKKMKTVGVQKIMVIQIGQDLGAVGMNETIMAAQRKLCKKNKNFVLVSTTAPKLFASYDAYYYDSIHINQYGLNKIGYEAGKAAGKYAKKASK